MAKYYRTYVVEINFEEWKKEITEDGFPEPTKEDFLKMCSEYDIDELAWWHGTSKYGIDVVEEHIEE